MSAAGDQYEPQSSSFPDSVDDISETPASGLGAHLKTAAKAAKGSAGDILDAAKNVASDASDRVEGLVSVQKDAGADRLTRIAAIIKRAADELEPEVPLAAPYIRRGAEEIEDFASALKTQSLGEIVGAIEDFARRQPAAFVGIAALASFAAVRFLKAPVKVGARHG